MRFLEWVDAPAHFMGGMMLAIMITKEKIRKKPALMFLCLALAGLGWEAIEAFLSSYIPDLSFVPLFSETIEDKLKDLIIGSSGFVCKNLFL